MSVRINIAALVVGCVALVGASPAAVVALVGALVGSTAAAVASTAAAVGSVFVLWPPLPFLLRFRDRLKGLSVSSLTDLAVLLAGRRRPALRAEWRAHLAGESGHDPVTWPKVRQALGFVASAVQLRLADAADLAWRPVDAMLGSRTLSNLFVWVPVIAMLMAIVGHDGLFGFVADIQDPAALGAFLYGVIRTGRWWRGIKPPEPRVRYARSLSRRASSLMSSSSP